MRPRLVDLILPINDYDICEADGMQNHSPPSSHELLIDNQET